ncbi:MAG: hypothetical protein V3R77_04325 [Candidatus Binatia bacterium]
MHAISGRARSSLVNVLFQDVSSLITALGPIWCAFARLATSVHE